MLSAILFAALLGAPIHSSAASQRQSPGIALTLELAPHHGLPGIPPSARITAVNSGPTAVTIPGANFRLKVGRPDESSFNIGCAGEELCGGFQSAWFEGPPRTGAFTLAAGASRSFLIGMKENRFFFDRRL